MGVSTQRQLDRMPSQDSMRDATASQAAWNTFVDELDAWAASGRTATLWWRDDDAVAATPALDRLLAVAETHGVPMALAVIPAIAEASLFARVARSPHAAILQHGYAHRNHAAPGAKKCELGPERPSSAVLTELSEGWNSLAAASDRRALSVLVPPWNRIDPTIAHRLGECGLKGLSTSKPRSVAHLGSGTTIANVHVDPIDWAGLRRGEDGFAGEGPTLDAAVRHLRARRLGAVDAAEPTGFLTHHLVMDDATWRFADRFAATVGRHPAARWCAAATIFADTGR